MPDLLTALFQTFATLISTVRAWVMLHPDVTLYLLPSVVIAAWLNAFHKRTDIYTRSITLVIGTFIHELMHLLVGALLLAKPVAMSIWPKRICPRMYQLGYVQFRNINWLNAAPTALAPLLGIVLIVFFVRWRTSGGWDFVYGDVLAWFAIAQIALSALPSATDWRVATRSWPWLLVGAIGCAFHEPVRHAIAYML